jgi:hypothetical protein
MLVLYGSEVWSFISEEEHRLRVFKKCTEKNIWTYEGGIDCTMEKMT